MATVCYINLYQSFSDRGAFVQKGVWQTSEVDESEIEIGEKLPHWPGCEALIVKSYDPGLNNYLQYIPTQLELEYKGKTITIKAGEEVQIDSSLFSQEYGVCCYILECVKVVNTKPVYKGDWQFADTILQKLQGPVGSGEVWHPNGDHFKGTFNLSYQSIWNEAYTAEGRYDFADGSYIEHAWINTDSTGTMFSLSGLFRVKHPYGADSIALFHNNKRYGVELFLNNKKASVKEWYCDEEQHRQCALEVVSYELDDTKGDDCLRLTMTLRGKDGEYCVVQQGGARYQNNWDTFIYKPHTSITVSYPNGDSVDDNYGGGLKLLRPYDFYVYVHCAATAQVRQEKWKDGQLVEAKAWERDPRAAKCLELPNPLGGKGTLEASVWADGHIKYQQKYSYDGDVHNDRPEGKGVLVAVGDEGTRYEGEFHEGRCHGQGVYDSVKHGIHQEGTWINGIYQEPDAATEPITLHARYGHQSWSVYSCSEWKYEECDMVAELGDLKFIGFGSMKIARIEKNCITLTRWDKDTYQLTPGETLKLSDTIEGREWSDGCVYDGDDYKLELTWKK